MPKPFAQWTVLPHGPLSHLDDNLLAVTGRIKMPLGEISRRMTVVRLRDSRLVVYSAIALDDAEMLVLEEYGWPSYLIVPNADHRMDARIWKARYPTIEVIAPEGARAKVDEVVPVDLTTADFGDPRVQFLVVPGTDRREAALSVETETGTTLVVSDLIFNLDEEPGFHGWLMRLFGLSGHEPHIPKVVAMRQIKDKEALAAQFEAWSHIRNLNRIIVSHGRIVTRDPPGVLAHLAASLAA
jgi:hypothetical protein